MTRSFSSNIWTFGSAVNPKFCEQDTRFFQYLEEIFRRCGILYRAYRVTNPASRRYDTVNWIFFVRWIALKTELWRRAAFWAEFEGANMAPSMGMETLNDGYVCQDCLDVISSWVDTDNSCHDILQQMLQAVLILVDVTKAGKDELTSLHIKFRSGDWFKTITNLTIGMIIIFQRLAVELWNGCTHKCRQHVSKSDANEWPRLNISFYPNTETRLYAPCWKRIAHDDWNWDRHQYHCSSNVCLEDISQRTPCGSLQHLQRHSLSQKSPRLN